MNKHNLTNYNYFLDNEYMSVSAYKKFNRCEFDGLSAFSEPTDAMLIGSYVDSYIEGTLEKFKEEHPQIFSSRGATKGELKADYKMADEICEFITNDEVFSQFMSGEKQTIMVGKINSVPFKIKMDSYSPGIAINDLKVMAKVTNNQGEFYDFITPWGYDIQLACYQEIVRQNTGEQLPCFICAVTKESPINSVIVNIPQYVLDKALVNVEMNIQHYYDVKQMKVEPVGCGKCKSCIASRSETPIITMEQFVDFGY